MPRPLAKIQANNKRRPKHVDEQKETGSGDDSPEKLTKDQQRALKRFKAGMEDDQSEGTGNGSDDDDDGGGDSRDETDDDEEDGDSEEDGGDGEGTLEEQVADVPFEVLDALRRDGRGLVGPAARAAAARASTRNFRRENKDRPLEMSSKRPVGRFREVIQVPQKRARDPRFDSAEEPPSTDVFRRRYSFLYNEMLPQEKAELQTKLKKQKNPNTRAQLQSQLQRVEAAMRDEDLRRRTQKLESEWKSKERSAVAAGKTPYFLKTSDKKQLALLAKYQELKERGKLDKFMEKRRKKNAAKDHRYLPSGRRGQGQE
ncbi:hypothetical protein Vafri_20819 [Volvox africanus]|uniref:rRNA biogenesis protein RRP36 n=1 Tax=Volvox africanus TaxID=51714 RepID=A0A8J4BS29_9CHLO|nr:hypothetical protein Vafri_20819 [Volvox africanus]